MKKIIAFIFCVAVISGCGKMKSTPKSQVIEIVGIIEKKGTTTYQYGTHLLKTESKTYALKSSNVNLDAFIGKKVKLKGTKVTGYPIEDGPEFIDVTEVTLNKSY